MTGRSPATDRQHQQPAAPADARKQCRWTRGARPAVGKGRGRMSIMDRRLRRAPDPEWVLMYRSGLSRARIAALVRAEPATIGYHLVIARRHDPGPGGRTPGRRRHRTGPRPLPRGSDPHG